MGRKSSFSEAQIVAAVREVEGGAKAGEVARKVGVSVETMRRGRERFSGMIAYIASGPEIAPSEFEAFTLEPAGATPVTP